MKNFSDLFFLAFFLTISNLAAAQGKNNRLLFVANLTGDQETPAVTTNARGVATVLLSEDGTALRVHGVFSGLSGAITGCHFHFAAEGVNGPVTTNFTTNIKGNTLRADIPVPANFLSRALNKSIYLNVHTAANPGGEIRGQLVLATDIQYVAILTGAEEVPATTSTATGIFRLTYSPGHSKGQYTATYTGLSGPATAAHIHNAKSGVSGPVVAPLMTGLPNTYVGDLDFTALPADFLSKLKDGSLYVNIHTAANPGGEIRGQLRPLGPLTFEAFLNGDQETPPVTTTAIGSAVGSINATLDSVTYYVTYNGITPTAAHFHAAAPGVAGPVIVPLVASATPKLYTAKVPMTPAQAALLLNGNVYVNIHTAANPGGEIRGQMESNIRRVYAFDLCGQQEVPSNTLTGVGVAAVSIDRLNTNLNYLFLVDGLSGAATAAHFHKAPFGVNGGVYKAVSVPAPASSGVISINGNDAIAFESDSVYLNVHTASKPAGELRGQVRRTLTCAINTSVKVPEIAAIKLFPNPTSGFMQIQLNVIENFEGQVQLMDLMGKVVRSENRNFSAGDQAVMLDLAALPVGVYLAQIRSTLHGTVETFKVIKE